MKFVHFFLNSDFWESSLWPCLTNLCLNRYWIGRFSKLAMHTHYTEVRFINFPSGRFTIATLENRPDGKLVNPTTVHDVLLKIRRLQFFYLAMVFCFRNCSDLCDNYVPQWWVEFDDELSWLFTNRCKDVYLICRK